jgi:aminopeptidase N
MPTSFMRYSLAFNILLVVIILPSFTIKCPFLPFPKTNEKTANWQADYDVKFYKIDIETNDTTTYVSGNVTILGEVKVPHLTTFTFELGAKLSVDSIQANHQKATFRREGDIVKVNLLPNTYTEKNLLSITVYYKGSVVSGGFFSPVANRVDSRWKIPVTWSLSEPLSAKYWFPCKQVISDKADSAYIFITVPKKCKAGSNGLLTGVTPIGKNKMRYEWKTKFPIAYYLLSFAVADYQEYSFYAKLNDKDSVFVQNYIYNRPNYLENNKENIDLTKKFLAFYSSVFGVYPFLKEKYGHCAAPMGGGMENQTMTTLSSFDYNLVSHELAHQWFGDWVTCATWQDVWINEGFASYSEFLALEKLKSVDDALVWMRAAQQNALNEPAGSLYVPLEDSKNDSRIFSNNITYKKGAAIIHMLRYELSDDSLFFSILRRFLSVYKDSVATGDNFFNVVNLVTGKNYHWFLDQWYLGKGYPNFDISWIYAGQKLKLYSTQTPSNPATHLFKTHFDIRLIFNHGDTLIRLWQDTVQKEFTIPVNREVIDIDFDPNSWLLKKEKNHPFNPMKS